jgi:hypothetical protein
MDSFFRNWIRFSGTGLVFQGLDRFFRDGLVLQGLDWIDFSGIGFVFGNCFSGFDRSFGYWIGLSGIGLIFQELDAMIFLRIGLRIGWIGFFKGWNLFSQIWIKNG